MYVFDCIQRGGIACGQSETWYCSIGFWNKQFLEQFFSNCLLDVYWLGLEKGLGSVYLINGSKLAYSVAEILVGGGGGGAAAEN